MYDICMRLVCTMHFIHANTLIFILFVSLQVGRVLLIGISSKQASKHVLGARIFQLYYTLVRIQCIPMYSIDLFGWNVYHNRNSMHFQHNVSIDSLYKVKTIMDHSNSRIVDQRDIKNAENGLKVFILATILLSLRKLERSQDSITLRSLLHS